MTYKYDGYNWLVKLNKGELLVESLLEVVKKEDIKGAWVSGLGGVVWVELGYYDLEGQQYHWQKRDDLPELTGLQGNVAWKDSEPVLHLHGTFSDAQMRGFGGHIKEMAVGGTCEILIHRWYEEAGLTRSEDPETGLVTLNV